MSANCDFCMVELHSIRSVVIALYICDSSKRQRQQPITPYLIALHIEYISICVLSLSLSLLSVTTFLLQLQVGCALFFLLSAAFCSTLLNATECWLIRVQRNKCTMNVCALIRLAHR